MALPPPSSTPSQDDQTSDDIFDALADVFLTGQIPSARIDGAASSSVDGPASPSQSVPPTMQDPNDPLLGPGPFRLHPKLSTADSGAVNTAPRKTSEAHKGATSVSELEEESTDSPVETMSTPESELELQQDSDPPSSIDFASSSSGLVLVGDDEPAAEIPTEADYLEDEQSFDDSDPLDHPTYSANKEVVLLGNLPGLAGPWLTQYAQLIANEEGPVAVVYLGDDAFELELIEPSDQQVRTTVNIRPDAQGDVGLLSLLEALLQADQPVTNVLLHAEPDDDPAALRFLLSVDDWTLLTGSDDAATVAGYRRFKQLSELDPAFARRQIAAMLMGSDEAHSKRAFDKLYDASSSFLDSPIHFIGHHQRMIPVKVRHLGRFPADAGLWPRLSDMLAHMQPTELTPGSSPAPGSLPENSPPPGNFSESVVSSLPETSEPKVEKSAQEPANEETTYQRTTENTPSETTGGEGVSGAAPRTSHFASMFGRVPLTTNSSTDEVPAAALPEIRQVTPTSEPTPPTTPVIEPEPAISNESHSAPVDEVIAEPKATQASQTHVPLVQENIDEPYDDDEFIEATDEQLTMDDTDGEDAEGFSLTSLLTQPGSVLDGAIEIDARCPNFPEAELAVDEDGCLHILAQHDTSAGHDQDTLDHILLEMMQTRRWVIEHYSLLQLTRRQLRLDPEAMPMLHLFTDRADLATKLIPRLGNEIRLHLLQELQIGSDTAWFCTPLS